MEYGWNCAAAAGLRGLNHRARILLLTSVDVRTRPKDKKGAANCKKKGCRKALWCQLTPPPLQGHCQIEPAEGTAPTFREPSIWGGTQA